MPGIDLDQVGYAVLILFIFRLEDTVIANTLEEAERCLGQSRIIDGFDGTSDTGSMGVLDTFTCSKGGRIPIVGSEMAATDQQAIGISRDKLLKKNRNTLSRQQVDVREGVIARVCDMGLGELCPDADSARARLVRVDRLNDDRIPEVVGNALRCLERGVELQRARDGKPEVLRGGNEATLVDDDVESVVFWLSEHEVLFENRSVVVDEDDIEIPRGEKRGRRSGALKELDEEVA